jgi:hypothetical protein
VTRLGFNQTVFSGRCVVCNGVLDEVPRKEEVRELVPDFIYLNFSGFLRCLDCGKVYWEGSHHKGIRDKVKGVLSAAADRSSEEEKH